MRLLKVLQGFEVRGFIVRGNSGDSILVQFQGSLEGEIHGESLGKGDQS